MTTIRKINTVCHICGTSYSGNVVASYSNVLPKPKIEPLVCPRCKAPYRKGVKPHTGMAKTVLQHLLESKNKAATTLFNCSRTKDDLEKWIVYIKDYVTSDTLKQWKEHNTNFVSSVWDVIKARQKGKTDASKTPEEEIERRNARVSKIRELYDSGKLEKLLDEVKELVNLKLQEETKKYKPK